MCDNRYRSHIMVREWRRERELDPRDWMRPRETTREKQWPWSERGATERQYERDNSGYEVDGRRKRDSRRERETVETRVSDYH